jgi:hypothetical protein
MMKGDLRWRWRNKMQHDNQPANKRQPGEEVDKRWWRVVRRRWHAKRTRGGGDTTTGATIQPAGEQEANCKGGISGQDAMERQEDKRRQRHNKRCYDNQPANKRQKGGEELADKEAAVS